MTIAEIKTPGTVPREEKQTEIGDINASDMCMCVI